jgi:signal transduction histidine kinase
VLLAKTVRSSTLKLALISIGIFGALVFALLGYVYWSTVSFVRAQTDRAIAAEQAVLQKSYAGGGRVGLVSEIAQRVAANAENGRVYLLTDAAFAPLAGNLAAWPAGLAGAQGWGSFSPPDRPPDARPVRAVFETLPDGGHLLVARNVEELGEFTKQIDFAALLGALLIVVLAAVASFSVTRRTVGRIEAINATSRAIMRSGLGQRIPVRGTHDEWDQLAGNLNLMLDRIEALMAEVKQVTDNLAHDLRTPLARIRGRLEKARQAAGRNGADNTPDQALIGDTLADLDSVLRMFTSLTRISQIEASDRMAGFRTVDLAEIAGEVVELFDAAAEDRGGQLSVSAERPVLVNGDRDLLFDAVSNLVDNAIKHGRAAGNVVVEVTTTGSADGAGGAVISVADDGPGIPADQSQNVFKRFFRLEQSRSTPGNGLGLSLVAAVARLHGAAIDLEGNAPGLRVRLRFPSVQEQSRAAE